MKFPIGTASYELWEASLKHERKQRELWEQIENAVVWIALILFSLGCWFTLGLIAVRVWGML